MSHSLLIHRNFLTTLKIGAALVSIGACLLVMTPSAMAVGVITEDGRDVNPESHRERCSRANIPVDFSVRVFGINFDVNSLDGKVEYRTDTKWQRCGDNGVPRGDTRAYAVFGKKYCELSGWYAGSDIPGQNSNAYDCVKFVGAPPDTYKGGSGLSCVHPDAPPGQNGAPPKDAECLKKPYGPSIIRALDQPTTAVDSTPSAFNNENAFYVPNWNKVKKKKGSYTFKLGKMCQYFKYGNGFSKNTSQNTTWQHCVDDAKITVRWKVTTPPNPVGNFDPKVTVSPDIVEPNDDEYTEESTVTRGTIPYAAELSRPKQTTVTYQLGRMIYPPGLSIFNMSSSTTSPSCAFYGQPNPAYCKSDFKSGQVTDTVGLFDGSANHTETFPDDVPPGSRVCYTMAVEQPWTIETHNYSLYQPTGEKDDNDEPVYKWFSYSHRYYSDEGHPGHDGYAAIPAVSRSWKYDTACVVVGKRPKVQVLGSDLRVRGETRTKVTRHTTGGDSRYFGSWVEYAALTKGTDSAPASGAGYREGTTSSLDNRSEWSKLTFANTLDYGGFSTLPSAPDITNHYQQQTEGKSPLVGSLASGTFRNNGPVTIGESTGLTGTTILYSEGTVTITGNIRYKDDGYTSLDDIPQVIIVAENINITSNVTNIDAWLIAYGSNSNTSKGNINTCSDGPAPEARTYVACSNVLEVNGPVVANGLYLNRTGPSNGGPSDAAEKFRLRPDAYIWAQARQRSTGAARTVDIVELPPRF